MAKEIIVEICMGSSCFARGNNITAKELQKVIKERGWGDVVKIKGVLCQDSCKDGPIVIQNNIKYKHIDMASLLDAIEEELKGDQDESV